MSGVDQSDSDKDEARDPCDDGEHSEVVEFPQVPGDEKDPKARIAAGGKAAITEGDRFEMAAAEANFKEPGTEIKKGNQIGRNLNEKEKANDENGESQKTHLRCVICGKTREVDHVLNRKSIVEAKSGNPRNPAQIANNKKFVADGGKVTYKLPDPVNPQRAQALLNDGFSVVAVPF